MKWDFNADLGAGGWAPGLPAALTDQDPLVAHYEGLYRLQDAIRRWFPDLVLEMCASGGGRMDGELLSRSHFELDQRPAWTAAQASNPCRQSTGASGGDLQRLAHRMAAGQHRGI